MTKHELIKHLRCNLWGTAKNLEQAKDYLEAVIGDLRKEDQGDVWIAIGIAMNTLANEIEKLED